MKIIAWSRVGIGVCCASALVFLAGCGSAPEAPTVAQQQQATDEQIQSIQNNPNMPPEAKQRAIQGLKFQQSRSSR